MVFEVTSNSLYVDNPSKTASTGQKVDAPNTIFSSSDLNNNNDEINKINSEDNVAQKIVTRRTQDELYQTVKSLLTGIVNNRSEALCLLEKISGYNEEILLNLDDKEINKYVECLKAALKKLKRNNNEKIDIKELGELANDYNIAISTGWTIDEYEKAQKSRKESITERIKRFYPNEKNFKKAVERYFKDYLSTLSSQTQLKDFGRLLTNSSDEEVKYFKEAIKTLHKENKLPGFDALLRSLDCVARTNFANDCNVNYIDEIGLSEHEDVRDITNLIAREQSFEGRQSFHNDFNKKAIAYFEEHKDAIKRINDKLNNGEQLTPEEQKIKDRIDNFYKAVTEGEITGTASNLNLDDVQKNTLLVTINNDTLHINDKYDDTFYKDVMTKVSEYVQEHPETLTMSPEDFYKLMDEVTDGKFTDIYNNSHPDNPLNYKSETTSTSTPTSQTTIITDNTSVCGATNETTWSSPLQSEKALVPPLSSNYTTVRFSENSTPFSPILKKVSEFFDLNKNENKTIKDVGDLIERIQNDKIDENVKKYYSKLPTDLQERVLDCVDTNTFDELLSETDEKLFRTECNFLNNYKNQLINNYKNLNWC